MSSYLPPRRPVQPGTRERSVKCVITSALVAALCGTGCSHRFIVFTTGTSIGIEATAEEGSEQRLVLGYKRSEGAYIPTRNGDDALLDEAYSVYAALGLDAGLMSTSIYQVFATGRAANTRAGSTTGLAAALTHLTEVEEIQAKVIRDRVRPLRKCYEGNASVRQAFDDFARAVRPGADFPTLAEAPDLTEGEVADLWQRVTARFEVAEDGECQESN